MKKQFRDFESAREFVRKLNLKTDREWRQYCKSGEKPNDIPYSPHTTYKNKGYVNQGDWLGTGKSKNFRPFKEAREFAISLNLKSQKEWQEYCKSGEKPNDIPFTPKGTYKKDWKGMGDWLGTGNVHGRDMVFRPFKEAREFAISLNLEGRTEWRQYCKSGEKPNDIPANPDNTYKIDFTGWGDWLGTGKIAPKDRVYRPFSEAREFVRSLGLKSGTEWHEYCKSGNKPKDIPDRPHYTYKEDFKGMGDWLNNGFTRDYRPFKDAREFVRSLNLKSQKEWNEYCKSGNKPNDIPNWAAYVYKNKGWKSSGDWLGTNFTNYQDRTYRSFEDAREFVRKLGLKNREEWMKYCKSGEKPNDIPTSPRNSYKEEFTGWGDWLGNGKIRDYRSFKDAREFVRSLNLKNRDEWREYLKSGNKPDDIPFFPEGTYKNDFKGVGDWLGTGSISSREKSKKWLPFKEAKIEAQKIVKKLGILTNEEWIKAHKEGKIPDYLPRYPRDIYKKDKKK